MTEQNEREKLVRTVDTCFSGLKADPWLAQRVLASAKGEVKVKKKLSFGLILALCVMLATVAVAIAAQQLGWVDFFSGYDHLTVPKTAEDALNSTQAQAFTVGPMTFTVKQLLADGRIAMVSTEARLTDGSDAVYAADCNDLIDPVDAGSKTSLAKYGLKPGNSWLEVAQETGKPLYRLRATLEVAAENDAGCAMEDALWNEDGSIVYFSMPYTLPDTIQDTLNGTMYLDVILCDPVTGDELDRWTDRQPITVPVAPLLGEKTYKPEGEATIGGMTLESIHAEQYATGIYLTSTFTVPEGMDAGKATDAMYRLTLCDDSGVELPMGLNLSGEASTDALPSAALMTMTSVETMPESIVVTDGEAKVVTK